MTAASTIQTTVAIQAPNLPWDQPADFPRPVFKDIREDTRTGRVSGVVTIGAVDVPFRQQVDSDDLEFDTDGHGYSDAASIEALLPDTVEEWDYRTELTSCVAVGIRALDQARRTLLAEVGARLMNPAPEVASEQSGPVTVRAEITLPTAIVRVPEEYPSAVFSGLSFLRGRLAGTVTVAGVDIAFAMDQSSCRYTYGISPEVLYLGDDFEAYESHGGLLAALAAKVDETEYTQEHLYVLASKIEESADSARVQALAQFGGQMAAAAIG